MLALGWHILLVLFISLSCHLNLFSVVAAMLAGKHLFYAGAHNLIKLAFL